MQVLFKESCIPVENKITYFHEKEDSGEQKKHCRFDENDGRSCLEGKGLKVKLTNLLADLFEDEVI